MLLVIPPRTEKKTKKNDLLTLPMKATGIFVRQHWATQKKCVLSPSTYKKVERIAIILINLNHELSTNYPNLIKLFSGWCIPTTHPNAPIKRTCCSKIRVFPTAQHPFFLSDNKDLLLFLQKKGRSSPSFLAAALSCDEWVSNSFPLLSA